MVIKTYTPLISPFLHQYKPSSSVNSFHVDMFIYPNFSFHIFWFLTQCWRDKVKSLLLIFEIECKVFDCWFSMVLNATDRYNVLIWRKPSSCSIAMRTPYSVPFKFPEGHSFTTLFITVVFSVASSICPSPSLVAKGAEACLAIYFIKYVCVKTNANKSAEIWTQQLIHLLKNNYKHRKILIKWFLQ